MPRIARTAVLDVPHPVAPRGNPISAAPNWVDPVYDAAGNMTLAPRPGAESDADEALLMVYDGWNRLAKAYEDTDGDGDLDVGTDALIAQYQYDVSVRSSAPRRRDWRERGWVVAEGKEAQADDGSTGFHRSGKSSARRCIGWAAMRVSTSRR